MSAESSPALGARGRVVKGAEWHSGGQSQYGFAFLAKQETGRKQPIVLTVSPAMAVAVAPTQPVRPAPLGYSSLDGLSFL